MSPIAVALIGALGGIALALTGDHFRRKWDRDEQARKLISQYRDPLLRAAFDLQSRLYNIVVWNFLDFLRGTDGARKAYAVDTTLWHFAHYLGWVEILRHEVQFLDLGTARRNKELQSRLGAVAHALASDRADFRPTKEPPAEQPQTRSQRTLPPRRPSSRAAALEPAFIIFRTDQQAIGEAMFKERAEGDEPARLECLTYSEFAAKIAGHDSESALLKGWCQRFARDLEKFSREDWSRDHPRLIAIQRGLIDLIDLLDPDQQRFPNRDARGKIPGPVATQPKPYRLARFIWRGDPWPTVEDWTRRYAATEIDSGPDPTSRTFVRPTRTRLGVTLVVRVTYDPDAEAPWVSIEGWTRMPRALGRLRLALPTEAPLEEWGDDSKRRLPLESNSVVLGSSQRRARHAANQLLHAFGRPRVVADPGLSLH
jgi:hypothetical protein